MKKKLHLHIGILFLTLIGGVVSTRATPPGQFDPTFGAGPRISRPAENGNPTRS